MGIILDTIKPVVCIRVHVLRDWSGYGAEQELLGGTDNYVDRGNVVQM